ncbi:MAG: PAS domain S-box protein [Chloroflexi bacterium]|nr:PAS domain S-box protein [Chloroflexota bacterium]
MAANPGVGAHQPSAVPRGSGPMRLFLVATISVLLIESLLLITMGRGPVLFRLPWVEITVQFFVVIAALGIAYFCVGRYRVLGEPGTLWVGLAFWAYAIFGLAYFLVIKGTVDGGAILNVPPNAADWPFHYKKTALAVLLAVAALARWPRGMDRNQRYPPILFSAIGLLCMLILALTFALGDAMPSLVAEGRFTLLNQGWTAAIAAVFALGALLSLRCYRRAGEVVVGYAATVQIVLAIRLASDVFGGQLYDVIWYFNRVLLVGSFCSMLLVLLAGHVELLRRQQQLSAVAQARASRLQVTLDSMADAVFTLDAQANVIDVNISGLRLLGFARKEEALGPLGEYREFLKATYLDGTPLRPENYTGARALRGETVRGFLEQAQMWDGRKLTLELSAAPIRGPEGEITGAVVVMRDVTEVELARIRATVARVTTAVAKALSLEDIVQQVLDEAAAALRADAAALYGADEARRQLVLLGQRNVPEDMVKRVRTISFDAPTLVARAIAERRIQVLEDLAKAPADLLIPRELGERFGFGSLTAVPLIVGRRVVGAVTYATFEARRLSSLELEAIGTISDIMAIGMENARLYEAAQEERRRLTAIIDNSPVGIMLFEAPSGRILLANKFVEQLVGRPVEHEAPMAEHPRVYNICRADGSLYPADDLPSARALHGEVILGQEVHFCQADGRMMPILVYAAPIRNEAGQITGAVAVIQDISQIRELERQREEFISVVAHDLRGAMTPIRGYADYLMRPGTREALPFNVQQALATIATNSRRMERMISDLLDVSRIEARRLALIKRQVDIPGLVRDIVQRSRETTRGHRVRLQIVGPIPPVEADPDRVEQVLGNLLSNAAKYSYPGAPITVDISPGAGEVMISVTNLGQGITSEDQNKLFTRFHRTRRAQEEKVPGLGLGLYIARGLVEAHGGRIWVESEPDKYATFRFTLPV